MKSFLISEMFRLEIRWESVVYERPGVCRFKGAYFTGPVLQVAQKLNEKDHMLLDFYSQYIQLVKGTYVGKFDWEGIEYSEDGTKIFLKKASMVHEAELNSVPNLNSHDYFAIDTSNHVVEQHSKNLVYKTYLINPDNDLYRFER